MTSDLQVALPGEVGRGVFDLVVANILAGPLLELKDRIAALVRPGGRLALSGLLAEQGDTVAAAYTDGFELAGKEVQDGWLLLDLLRRTGSGAGP